MKYSFISTSQGGRYSVFVSFIKSLHYSKLEPSTYEVVFIDQTEGEYDELLCGEFSGRIKVIKSSRIGLSKARNLALKFARGDVVFFSDDDADYSDFDFSILDELFSKHDLVSFQLKIAPDGLRNYGNRAFPYSEKYLGVIEIFSLCLSLSVAVKRKLLSNVGGFDERFGAGAIYGGSEETDLLLKLYEKGYKPFYTPRLIVMHPDEYLDISYDEKCKKFHRYSIGYARICRKYCCSMYGLSFVEWLRVTFRVLVGFIFFKEKKFYASRLSGLIMGFLK